LEKQHYMMCLVVFRVSEIKCVSRELFIGSAGNLEGGAEGFEVFLGIAGGLDEEMDAEGIGLDFLVFFKRFADGDEGEAEDLAGGEIHFGWDAHIVAQNTYGEALLGGLSFEGDAGKDQEIGFADLVVGVIRRDGVRAADGGDEGLGEVAGEGHGAGEDAGLKGFADFRGDLVVVRAVEAEGFVDGQDGDGGGSCEEGEKEKDG
jgi:hypothetical protein